MYFTKNSSNTKISNRIIKHLNNIKYSRKFFTTKNLLFGNDNLIPNQHKQITDDDTKQFDNFIKNNQPILVITGAGISTESVY